MQDIIVLIREFLSVNFGCFGMLVWQIVKVSVILIPIILLVAYLTLAERKVIGYMQARLGANRVGPYGLLQPFADLFKSLFKETIIPEQANKVIFYLAPVLSLFCIFIAFAVIPFGDNLVFADINVGLLYVLMITSLGVYSIILAGWSSNSKYAFLGGIRSTAQTISYELAMGFALIGVLMVSGSLNLSEIVKQQSVGMMGGGILSWNWIPLFPLFLVYIIAGIAETNRAPFDICEGESEIVAGFHVEYSGSAFAVFMLAEYTAMVLISVMTAIMFLGGWLSIFPACTPFLGEASIFWLLLKTLAILFGFIWYRATFPRYRYDQIMRLGWKVLLPVTLVWIIVLAIWMVSPLSIW